VGAEKSLARGGASPLELGMWYLEGTIFSLATRECSKTSCQIQFTNIWTSRNFISVAEIAFECVRASKTHFDANRSRPERYP